MLRWVALAAMLAACGGGASGERMVRVFAAASLTDAFGELAARYEDANPGTDVVLNLAASSSLRQQIDAGAPADVLATASPDHAAGLDAEPVAFAENELQLAVPAGNPGDVRSIADLARDELLVGLCAAGVPCGDVARRALDAAGVDAAVDTEEPDARGLLAKLAAGELDAGLVYRTDVLAAAGEVEGIALPERIDATTTYVLVALDPGGEAFAGFVLGPAGRAVLADHGFFVR